MPEKKAAAAKAPKANPTTAEAEAPASQAKAAASTVVSVRGSCTAEKCQLPLRAKGYCRKHFLAWRRGELGAHHHYKICTKEACRKKREFGSLCAEHAGKGVAAPDAAATS